MSFLRFWTQNHCMQINPKQQNVNVDSFFWVKVCVDFHHCWQCQESCKTMLWKALQLFLGTRAGVFLLPFKWGAVGSGLVLHSFGRAALSSFSQSCFSFTQLFCFLFNARITLVKKNVRCCWEVPSVTLLICMTMSRGALVTSLCQHIPWQQEMVQQCSRRKWDVWMSCPLLPKDF